MGLHGEAENAVLRNILRETARRYDGLLEEAANSSQSVPVLPLKKAPSPDADAPAMRPTALSPADVDGVAANLVRETTERYEASRGELAVLRAQLSTILGTIREAVIRTDARATVEELNPAAERLTGWRSSAAQGRPLIDVVMLNDSAGQATVLDLVPTLVHGESRDLEAGLFLERRDGVIFAVGGRLAALRDHGDEVTGLVLVMRELSDVDTGPVVIPPPRF